MFSMSGISMQDSKETAMLLLICCCLLLPLLGSVFIPCFVVNCLVPFLVLHHFDRVRRAGFFTVFVFLASCDLLIYGSSSKCCALVYSV